MNIRNFPLRSANETWQFFWNEPNKIIEISRLKMLFPGERGGQVEAVFNNRVYGIQTGKFRAKFNNEELWNARESTARGKTMFLINHHRQFRKKRERESCILNKLCNHSVKSCEIFTIDSDFLPYHIPNIFWLSNYTINNSNVFPKPNRQLTSQNYET